MRFLLRVVALLFLLQAASAQAQPAPEVFLQKYFSLSQEELADARSGNVVGKILKTKRKTEVALLGITRLSVPKEFILSHIRKITTFKKGKEVLQIGTLDTLSVKDLKGLTLDEGDLDAIGDCKSGDCGLKLPAAWMERFQKETDPRSKSYANKANELFRELLLDLATSYLSKGNEALPEYNSSKNALRLQDEFQDILVQSKYLSDAAPEFYEYLKEFPKKELPGVEGYIYWSKEKFGFKPVISMTNVIIHQRTFESSQQYMVASKQIYADHYYDGSLGLSILMDDPKNSKGCYLIYVNRSRIDALGGFLSGLRRAIAQPRIRSGMENNLKLLKQRLETEYKEQSQTKP